MAEAVGVEVEKGPALVDLPYSNHDVSSVLYGHDVGTGFGRGRMDAVVGWNADINDKSPWIRLDLEATARVLGIATAGRGDQMEWVAQYRVQYSLNGESWTDARPLTAPTNLVFDGNIDFVSRKDSFFAEGGVRARYIRVHPVHWVGPTAAMRVGLIMEAPVSLPLSVTVTPLSRLPGNAMPPLEKEVPIPKLVLYANWEGYDGECEEAMDNEETVTLLPAVPSIAQMRKQRAGVRAVSWSWAPIQSLPRKDNTQLYHWVRTAEKDAEYPFVKLNVALTDVPTYTDEEYAKVIQPRSADWTRADTDHLMDLVQRFDRRFVIVHDRFTPATKADEVPIERSIEDLQDRYYRICTMLRAHRAGERVDDELENNMPYDAAHEKLRRKQLALLFARTAEEAEEEDFVATEFKKINQRLKKEKNEREREQSVDTVKGSLTPQKGRKKSRKESMTSMVDSTGEPEVVLKKQKKGVVPKEEPRVPFSPAPDAGFATPSASTPSVVAAHGAAARKSGVGATLNSTRLLQPYQQMPAKLSKKIISVYEQYSLTIEKLMPSSRVLAAAEELKNDVSDLIELQKQLDRLEAEAKALRMRIAKGPQSTLPGTTQIDIEATDGSDRTTQPAS